MGDRGDWIRVRKGPLLMGAILLLLGLWWWQGRPLSQPGGVLAPDPPVQTKPEVQEPWTYRNHRMTPLADFAIRARVLGVEAYRLDRAAELSPLDVALGWGPMSDSRILKAFSIRQQNRWYFWNATLMPVSESTVIAHSANMHLIPSSGAIEKRIRSLRTGQILSLRGQLIRADGKDGWHWVSSLSREDAGDGSCEVVWVASVEISDH